MSAIPDRLPIRSGVLWLLTDMVLITVMMAVVKDQGGAYPAVQLAFIRAAIGLVLILPLAWHARAEIVGTSRAGGHLVRVACSAIALTGNFMALAALPLALVTAIGFTRPLIVLGFAALLLGERIGRIRWAATSVGLLGVLIMVPPASAPWNLGLLAAFASTLFGSLAVIQVRALKAENTTALMVFYALGLGLLLALPAWWLWVPVRQADWPALLTIGLLGQLGQYCFLRAYQSTPARILAPVGYLSIVFATATGFLFFNEVPGWTTLAGVAVILASVQVANSYGGKPE